MSNGNNSHAQDRVQSYPWTTTQQGHTFVPGRESRQSRADRVNTAVQAVDHHFPSQYVVGQQQQQGHRPQAQGVASRNGAGADLYGVGQQFHGYTHR